MGKWLEKEERRRRNNGDDWWQAIDRRERKRYHTDIASTSRKPVGACLYVPYSP